MPTSYRESVDTASAIKAILDSYPFGNGLLREILQNSDDAGASKQIFVLDHQTHPTETLLDPCLTSCQGPALLCFNDSVFKESDWQALSTIHGSNKTADETKAGKYGLGFRSCYHVTDNPHILSGTTLAILDPHNEFQSPYNGGQNIDLLEEGSKYSDQLAPFRSLDPTNQYPSGTIIRLPLRNAEQAQRSRIKNKAFTPSDIQTLFREFVDKELSMAMLFLKHITSIELREIDVDGTTRHVGTVNIKDPGSITEQRTFTRGREAKFETFRCTISTPSSPQKWRIVHSVFDAEETKDVMSKRLGYDVGDRLKDDKLFSHIALAYPLDSSVRQGRLFTLLPLPIYTGFPLHIHAILALTPDRQALRNREETGLNAQSRERLLVEWNQAIFEHFLPHVWARLLDILVHDDAVSNIWMAWPRQIPPSQSYWSVVPKHLVQQIYQQELLVTPTISPEKVDNADNPLFTSLPSVLLASRSESLDTLRAFARAGLSIAQPDGPIYELLKSNEISLLNPKSAHPALLVRIPEIESLTAGDKNLILDFLLLSNDVTTLPLVYNLPFFPLVSNKYAALSKPSPSSTFPDYCLAISGEEEELFGDCDDNIISLRRIHKHASLFSHPRISTYVNASRISVDHLQKYLKKKVGDLERYGDAVSPPDFAALLPWIKRFWAWVDVQKEIPKNRLIAILGRFHLLPTSTNRVRKASNGILLGEGLGKVLKAVLSNIGVSISHPQMSDQLRMIKDLGFGRNNDDISFILGSLDSRTLNRLDVAARAVLQTHFLSMNGRSRRSLNRQECLTMQDLPIYPTLTPNGDGSVTRTNTSIRGQAVFVIDEGCPLPILNEDITYVDVSPPQAAREVARFLDPLWLQNGRSEISILKMAIPVLEGQAPAIMDALVARIISRWMDLSSSFTDLCKCAFVLVGNGQRRPPSSVVDPSSRIAGLYKDESDRLPAGKFAQEYLQTLRPYFIKALTADSIRERIDHIVSATNTRNAKQKAELLLDLMDKGWDPKFEMALQVDVKWIPVQGSPSRFCSPAESRCADKDRRLFDLVLPIASVSLSSDGLRSALGWNSPIPFSTSLTQLCRALDLPKVQIDHIVFLLKYFASKLSHGRLEPSDLKRIQEAVKDRCWIPSTQGSFLHACHAYFDHEVHVGEPFQHVHHDLLGNDERKLLLNLGCSERPAFEVLVNELQKLANVAHLPMDRVQKLLEEISLHCSPDLPVETRNEILIPVSHGSVKSLKPLRQVYYNDQGRYAVNNPERPYRVTTTISPQLAKDLGIPFASSLSLDEDDDEGDTGMSEDFCTRISGVLKDYDIAFAFNELLANAIDAGATRFSMCLDERSFDADRVLAPQLAKFNRGPAIVVYNDAVFTNDDFNGIRKVGQGGKIGQTNTIGRFGLGALSLFHFTDFPMIVSNGSVLLLDPSGEYLPRHPNGRPRTALTRPLTTMASKYRDQLLPLNSMFGFEMNETMFPGTLFRLPLRESRSPLSDMLLGAADTYELMATQYYDLARSAMIFTSMAEISAQRRTVSREPKYIWSVVRSDASTQSRATSNIFSHKTTSIKHRRLSEEPNETTYLIASRRHKANEIPEEHRPVVSRQKLSHSGLKVELAISFFDSKTTERQSHPEIQSYLFSTLRLPVAIFLPVHISAQFALASDRRSVRLDASDITGQRTRESEFNAWILSKLVPRLYMYALQFARSDQGLHSDNWSFWPTPGHDPFSNIVVESFYSQLKDCTFPICITPSTTYTSPQNARFCLSYNPPMDVRKVIKELGCNKYVRPPVAVRALCQDRELPIVDAPFIKTSIDYRSSEFKEFISQSEAPIKYSESIIEYLLDAKTSPAGLPLFLQDGSTSPVPSRVPLFFHPQCITHLFPSNRFLCNEYSDSAIALMVADSTLNVHRLSDEWLMTLLQEKLSHHTERRATLTSTEAAWVTRLWDDIEGGHLPDPRSIPLFSTLPLIPTFISHEFVNLDIARKQGVLLPMISATAGLQLAPLLNKLGIVLLREATPYNKLLNQERFSLTVLVNRLKENSMLTLPSLTPSEHNIMAKWVRGHLPLYISDASVLQSLRCLPVWPAWRRDSTTLISANDLGILPTPVSPRALQPYLRPNVAIAESSSALNSLHARISPSMPLSPSTTVTSRNITDYVQFPHTLNERDMEMFKTFICGVLDIGISSDVLMVPNGSLQLQPVNSFYDESVALFSSSFSNTRARKFIHPSLHDLQPRLRSHGLRYQKDISAGLDCANAIHNDLVVYGIPEQQMLPRATTVFEFYSDTLPSLAMSNASIWEQFEEIRFIPRDIEQNDLDDPRFQIYQRDLPLIVRINDVTLQENKAVCWTQRAVCPEANLNNVTALNKKFGVPTAQDVVEHLLVLATRVSLDHPGNRNLLSDITKSYQWLQDHSDEARPFLCAHSDKRIFLNVDNPHTGQWNWSTARSLVFDLQYDGKGLYVVHEYLMEYRKLLEAAGAQKLVLPKYQLRSKTEASLENESLRSRFSKFREQGCFLDCTLKPTKALSNQPTEDLRAHKAFLAACVSHLENVFAAGMEESTGFLRFHGTYFGARAIIEYIYTDNITCVEPTTGEEMGLLLQEILDLLDTSKAWAMPDLTEMVGALIERYGLLTVETVDLINDKAEWYGATRLVSYCEEFRRSNLHLLPGLRDL